MVVTPRSLGIYWPTFVCCFSSSYLIAYCIYCIEIVRSFCYLGIELNTAGSFSNATDRLQSKASREYINLRHNFNFHNGTSVKVIVNFLTPWSNLYYYMVMNYGLCLVREKLFGLHHQIYNVQEAHK